MKRLIVNADDFGRARGINAGVLQAHRHGIVTATTLMVNAPAADDAGAIARAAPSLDVGVHLTLTYGRPISDPATVRSLVERDGSFPRVPSAFLGTGRADRDEALREYRAQYARGQALLGRMPSHLDSHHWLHDEPTLEWAIAALAKETGAAVRPHDDGMRDRLRAGGIATADTYRRDFQHEGHVDIATLERILADIGADIGAGITELGCHPGEPDPELAATSTYASLRADELATLIDPRARMAILRNEITLCDYSVLR